jgi:hypothetical protein
MLRATSLLTLLALLAGCSSFETADGPAGEAAPDTHAGVVQTTFPSAEDPGGPFYARIDPAPPHVFDDGTHAAIVFYRGPEGIPPGFDLLGFFDVPGAFAVQSNVQGTNFWNGAPLVGSPRMSHSRELGTVPVWFVPAGAVHAQIATGDGLTIADLEAMEPLKGAATHFREVLHPHALPPEAGGGGHPVPKLNLTARGSLEDGRRFTLTITSSDGPAGQQGHTQIRF